MWVQSPLGFSKNYKNSLLCLTKFFLSCFPDVSHWRQPKGVKETLEILLTFTYRQLLSI